MDYEKEDRLKLAGDYITGTCILFTNNEKMIEIEEIVDPVEPYLIEYFSENLKSGRVPMHSTFSIRADLILSYRLTHPGYMTVDIGAEQDFIVRGTVEELNELLEEGEPHKSYINVEKMVDDEANNIYTGEVDRLYKVIRYLEEHDRSDTVNEISNAMNNIWRRDDD